MKLTLIMAVLALGTALTAPGQETAECAKSAQAVSLAVADDPSKVLTVVAGSIKANPDCACEIVKAAILAADADNKTVGAIVLTAVQTAPQKSIEISECAIAVKPDATEEVKNALHKALGDAKEEMATVQKVSGRRSVGKDPVSGGGKAPVSSGKNPLPTGKEPLPAARAVEEADDTVDFGKSPVAIGGVYLVVPANGGTYVDPRTVIRRVPTPPRVIIRRVTEAAGK
jgi:hypothetical protein